MLAEHLNFLVMFIRWKSNCKPSAHSYINFILWVSVTPKPNLQNYWTISLIENGGKHQSIVLEKYCKKAGRYIRGQGMERYNDHLRKLKFKASRKHAYIILIPINPTFI